MNKTLEKQNLSRPTGKESTRKKKVKEQSLKKEESPTGKMYKMPDFLLLEQTKYKLINPQKNYNTGDRK